MISILFGGCVVAGEGGEAGGSALLGASEGDARTLAFSTIPVGAGGSFLATAYESSGGGARLEASIQGVPRAYLSLIMLREEAGVASLRVANMGYVVEGSTPAVTTSASSGIAILVVHSDAPATLSFRISGPDGNDATRMWNSTGVANVSAYIQNGDLLEAMPPDELAVTVRSSGAEGNGPSPRAGTLNVASEHAQTGSTFALFAAGVFPRAGAGLAEAEHSWAPERSSTGGGAFAAPARIYSYTSLQTGAEGGAAKFAITGARMGPGVIYHHLTLPLDLNAHGVTLEPRPGVLVAAHVAPAARLVLTAP